MWWWLLQVRPSTPLVPVIISQAYASIHRVWHSATPVSGRTRYIFMESIARPASTLSAILEPRYRDTPQNSLHYGASRKGATIILITLQFLHYSCVLIGPYPSPPTNLIFSDKKALKKAREYFRAAFTRIYNAEKIWGGEGGGQERKIPPLRLVAHSNWPPR